MFFHKFLPLSVKGLSFDRSHGYKTTLDAGFLYPVYLDEVLPGDTFNNNLNAFSRLCLRLQSQLWIICILILFFFFGPFAVALG